MEVQWSKHPELPANFFHVGIGKINSVYKPHWHKHVEILFFLEESAPTRCFYQNNSVDATAGDLVIFNSNQVHATQVLGNYSSHLCLSIQREFLESFGLWTQGITFHNPIRDETVVATILRLRELLTAYREPQTADDISKSRQLLIKTELLSLYAQLLDRHSSPEIEFSVDATPDKHQLIQEVMLYIQEHLNESITLKSISDHVQFSQSYISHLFQKFTNSTIGDTINTLRCQNVHALLRKTDYSIIECAHRCGFSSTSYMARIYRRYFGESPSDTRRAAKVREK